MNTRTYPGQLEIDTERGVIYFHCDDPKVCARMGSVTLLRICQLPVPIPDRALDIIHLVGADWFVEKGSQDENEKTSDPPPPEQ